MPRKKQSPKKQLPKKDDRTTKDKIKDFLQAYSDTANVVRAAKLARIHRSIHYRWLEHAGYAKAFDARRRQAADYLEGEAVVRASEGWLEPVYYQGAKCGSVRRYSDGLMMLLLRGMLPEKYGNKTEITGPQGTPMQAKIEVVFVKPQP
jgi:hypothetical protein